MKMALLAAVTLLGLSEAAFAASSCCAAGESCCALRMLCCM
ncbi:MAG: hypothetical protein ORN49_00665 [Rhodobacteraceae bacterium]|nr:hypothetical protein [Paracoccaceae bacterium]